MNDSPAAPSAPAEPPTQSGGTRSPGTRTYRSSPRVRQRLLWFWALLLLLPGLIVLIGLLTSDSASVFAGLATGLLMSAVMLPIFWLAAWRYPRLLLTEAGVEVQQLGLRLNTEWDNLAGLLRAGELAFVLREPMTAPGANTQAAFGGTALYGAPLYTDEVQALIAERRYMPLKVFAYWLDQGDLAMELKARAPWLADDVDAAVAAQVNPPRRPFLADAAGQPLPRRSLVAIAALIALGIGLAVVVELGPAALSSGVGQVMALISGLVAGAYALVNFVAAGRLLRQGQIWPGLLWGALAVMMALVALAVFGSLLAA